jgi:hypothetical protein
MKALTDYLQKHSSSEEAKCAAIRDLCACEKYMVAMINVEDAHSKLDCIIFCSQYETRRKKIVDDIEAITKACAELKQSNRLRKLLGLILKLGNLINIGGEGKMEKGFSLDALMKLNEAKAFDKTTSVLFYLVKVTKQIYPILLSFKEDIPSVVGVERIMIFVLALKSTDCYHHGFIFLDATFNMPLVCSTHYAMIVEMSFVCL